MINQLTEIQKALECAKRYDVDVEKGIIDLYCKEGQEEIREVLREMRNE